MRVPLRRAPLSSVTVGTACATPQAATDMSDSQLAACREVSDGSRRRGFDERGDGDDSWRGA